jgi:hypothetical protein
MSKITRIPGRPGRSATAVRIARAAKARGAVRLCLMAGLPPGSGRLRPSMNLVLLRP